MQNCAQLCFGTSHANPSYDFTTLGVSEILKGIFAKFSLIGSMFLARDLEKEIREILAGR
jgi:hypothetical protein